MRIVTLFALPVNLLRGREIRSRSPHTTLWGMGRIYGKAPQLKNNILENLLARARAGGLPVRELINFIIRIANLDQESRTFILNHPEIYDEAIRVFDPLSRQANLPQLRNFYPELAQRFRAHLAAGRISLPQLRNYAQEANRLGEIVSQQLTQLILSGRITVADMISLIIDLPQFTTAVVKYIATSPERHDEAINVLAGLIRNTDNPQVMRIPVADKVILRSGKSATVKRIETRTSYPKRRQAIAILTNLRARIPTLAGRINPLLAIARDVEVERVQVKAAEHKIT